MKNKILAPILACFLFAGFQQGNAQVFQEGTSHLNLGIGFGGYLAYKYIYAADFTTSPTFMLSYDYGIVNDVGPGTIGIGGFAGFKTASYIYDYPPYQDKGTWTDIVFGARGSYHLNLDVDKLDVYGALTLGFYMETYDYTTNYPDPFNPNYHETYIYYSLSAGAAYMFKPGFGVFAEVGYDLAWLKAGVTLGFGSN